MSTLSTVEAARALGKTSETIRNWCKSGKLSSETDGFGCFRIPMSEVEQLARRQRVQPATQRRLLTVEEAAHYLCVPVRQMKGMVLRREIPYVPGPDRLDVQDLDAWIAQQKISARKAVAS